MSCAQAVGLGYREGVGRLVLHIAAVGLAVAAIARSRRAWQMSRGFSHLRSLIRSVNRTRPSRRATFCGLCPLSRLLVAAMRCTHKGCGQEYDPSKDTEKTCVYHSGAPVFHEGLKSWSCCSDVHKPVLDFDDFMKIPVSQPTRFLGRCDVRKPTSSRDAHKGTIQTKYPR